MARKGNCIALLGALFLTISASAFTGRPTPTPTTCPRLTLSLPVHRSAPSTLPLLGLGSQLQCLSDGASSHRIRMRSIKSRRIVLFARPKPSDDEMAERKEQLRDLLSAAEAEIDKLARLNPTVLNHPDISEVHGPKLPLLQNRLGISKKEASRLCLKANRLLNVSLETLEGRIDWLQARLNLSMADLRKIIKRSPVVLTCSTEE